MQAACQAVICMKFAIQYAYGKTPICLHPVYNIKEQRVGLHQVPIQAGHPTRMA